MSLVINDVSKFFNNSERAVSSLNIKADKGEIFGLIGQNGAGKTTTFRMILSILKPSSGSITWNGKKVSTLTKDNIGYLPEERGIYPKLTVEEQIYFFGKLKGMKLSNIKEEMDIWISFFDLEEKRNSRTEQLSKGNQQKVQLITSFIHKPSLLILDEPFSGLDPVNAELLKNSIQILKSKGTTIIFSTHRMDHVEELCDNLCLLKNGKALFSGSITDLKEKYGKRYLTVKGPFTKSELMSYQGVEKVSEFKDEYLVTLKGEKYSTEILHLVRNKENVEKFSLDYQSLENIFKLEVGTKYE